VLYHRATALLHPSLYEGFGFPIAEAMSAGLPVIAGNNSSQAEVFGDAALLVDARSIEDIARCILRMVQDGNLRAELAEKGRALCRRFTWRKVAEKTAMYLTEAIEHRTCRCSHTGKDTVTAPRFEKSSAAKV
jgi:glycosyltransferase involved in cell wall biosynthesis